MKICSRKLIFKGHVIKTVHIILYRFAKFDSFKANCRKAMIVFRFYANQASKHALTCLRSDVFLIHFCVVGVSLQDKLEKKLLGKRKSVLFFRLC